MAKHQKKRCRFLTLTTSDTQRKSIGFGDGSMNKSFRMLKYRIVRCTPLYLILHGYITAGQKRSFYPHKPLNEKLKFDYLKVHTKEGNEVLHIVFKGDYIPHSYLSDNWMDIHNSWDVNIKEIKTQDTENTASYIVSQYVANQESTFIRSSWSWKWVFKGFVKTWKSIMTQFRDYSNAWLDEYGCWHYGVHKKALICTWKSYLKHIALGTPYIRYSPTSDTQTIIDDYG